PAHPRLRARPEPDPRRLRRAAAGRARRGRSRRLLHARHGVAGQHRRGGVAMKRRDGYLDTLRAGSLLVVVAWHWFATILHWGPDGPHATSPLASVPGLWVGTWVLQVMPVFFYVGGYLHQRSYRRGFIARRVGGLLRSASPVLAGWALAGGV